MKLFSTSKAYIAEGGGKRAASRPTTAGKLARHVLHHVLRNGMRRTASNGWRHVADRYREFRLGINTRGSIAGEVLGHGEDSFGYQPIPYRTIDLALRSLAVDDFNTFVDFGCGKGRAVVAAGLWPFKRIIGVERSAELCKIARQTVAQARQRLRCPDIEIVEADARDYLPPDDVTVAFFFNPFDRDILLAVLERLRATRHQPPLPLKIIHGLPKCREDYLRSCAWLQTQCELTTHLADWEQCTVYQATWQATAAVLKPAAK